MRYAIYYVPDRADALWRLGSQWLGRDARRGIVVSQAVIPGYGAREISELTALPRRYGFHATLKPPFRLADGRGEDELVTALRAFAAATTSPGKLGLDVTPLDGFLALRPTGSAASISEFAAQVVESFDSFRAPLNEAEIRRWRMADLDPGHRKALQRWGYPYLAENYRFHITLTDRLADKDRDRLAPLLRTYFQPALSVSRSLDRVALFVEPGDGRPFHILQSFKLAFSEAPTARRGTPGRLVLVVGPSGAGKDTLIRAARQAFDGDDRFVFARRIVTRRHDPSREDHDTVDEADFEKRAAVGEFALSWKAYGLSYGLPASVDTAVDEGRVVIANVSRAVLAEARAKYLGLTIIHVTADKEVLAKRLSGRDRETPSSIERRLTRADAYDVSGPDVVVIDNSGSLEAARAAFFAAIAED